MSDSQKVVVAALVVVGAHTVYKRVKAETTTVRIAIRNRCMK